jgi:arginine utilization regulatory protein
MDRNDVFQIEELENIEDVCVHVINSEGNTICYSKGCEKIEGLKRDNVINKTINELYSFDENGENPQKSMQLQVLKTGETTKNNYVKYSTFANREIEVLSSTYPIFSEDKIEVKGAICIFRDIHDYVNMANTIKKLETDLAIAKAVKKNNGTTFYFSDVIYSSEAMFECITIARKSAVSNVPIMITGPTGAGKEVIAQSIHNESTFSNGPFVALNCSAIPDNLLESTLFGTCKGAFTGASETTGLFEYAANGTLFLDEINSMDMSLQSKLLRALETKLIRKIGGNHEIPINTRIISATNQNPLEAIQEKKLRADIYYRLATILITIPDLKDRKEDIKDLTDSFISHHSHIFGKQIKELSNEALQVLTEHNWPGNIRELKHVIEQSICLADFNDTQIKIHHLPKYICESYNKKSFIEKYTNDKDSLKGKLKSMEKEIVLEAYIKSYKNISKAARRLGVSRQTLQHKLKMYEIKN